MRKDRIIAAVPPSSVAADTPDLTACDREPIHIPGSIQPHGVMLIAEASTGRVVAGAGALEERLSGEWLNQPLAALLGQELTAAYALADADLGTAVPLAPVTGLHETFEASLFRSGGYHVAELEPQPADRLSAATLLTRLDVFAGGFDRTTDLKGLCERAAIAFRELTGFDRVMIYRFLDDAAGVVLAEDRDPAAHSFLNHHFPASDIPKQARALYVRNRVRVIPDIRYAPAPIRPAAAGLAELDLSDSALRSVSPIHIKYLENMGVGASASVSIVKDGLLWGLVACHHHGPRMIGLETRAACRALAGGVARQIRAKEEAANYRERIRLRGAEDAVLAAFAQDFPFDVQLGDNAAALQRMFDADGFAIVQGARRILIGETPDEAQLSELARWVSPRATVEPFASAALSTRFPPADAYRAQASGMMAVTLATETPALLLWFRAEQPQTVNWAGNPHKNAEGIENELTPRHSFAAWCEEVHGRSREWTLGEIDAAGRLRRSLFELRQSRRLRELNRELGATVAEKEALIQEKEHLLREVNHRVQNSLQLVQAFLALQGRQTPEIAPHLDEAQRRLSAVALVHRRLYQGDRLETVDLGRYLEELVAETRSALGSDWNGAIQLDLAPMLITPDRAVNVGLILTELIINANKYAYSGGAGPIAIALHPHRNQFQLVVADQGKGVVREHKGFGTRMMNAMVQRLGGTIEREDNRPGLRVVVTAPVEG